MPACVYSGYEQDYTHTSWLSIQALSLNLSVSLSSWLHRDDNKTFFFKAVVEIQKLKKICLHNLFILNIREHEDENLTFLVVNL